ncbi:unnamed protein product [marine sediment metagenome]|uniref:Uncharacterized protein n=1 Tax=marine sediment metagenome TaxID=412755 RepID=X0VYC5_9ZZZZ
MVTRGKLVEEHQGKADGAMRRVEHLSIKDPQHFLEKMQWARRSQAFHRNVVETLGKIDPLATLIEEQGLDERQVEELRSLLGMTIEPAERA